MTSLSAIIVAGLLLAASPPADDGRRSDAAQGLLALRDEDLRASKILFRLATSNRELCETTRPLSGLVLHDAHQYAPPFRTTAIAIFGLGQGPSVEAVVPDSPAFRANFRAGDHLQKINGISLIPTDLDRRVRADSAPEAESLTRVKTVLDQQLAEGAAAVEVASRNETRTLRLDPIRGCASLLQVIPSSKLDSGADGRMISITSAMIEFMRSDDELAIILAHELAHNVLKHREKLDASGRPVAMIRATETEADRTGLYFAARAGYDVRGAPELWRRLGGAVGANLLPPPSHPSPRIRARAAEATIAVIEAALAAGHQPVP